MKVKVEFSRRAVVGIFAGLLVVFGLGVWGASRWFLEGSTVKHLRVSRHLGKAREDLARGDFDTAQIEYRVALTADPSDTTAMGELGALYYRDGRVLPGYVLMGRAIQLGNRDVDVLASFGLACSSLGRIADARNAAKMVLNRDPANEDALLLLANTSITPRDAAETLRLVAGCRARAGRDIAGYHLAAGAIRLVQHDWAGADREFHQALALDPKSGPAHEGLGALCVRQGDMKGAAIHFQAAAEASPIRSPLRLKYADFLTQMGQPDAARRELEQIMAAAPDYIPAWTMAMELATSRKQYDAALAEAAQILKYDPSSSPALSRRAEIKLNRGDVDGAISDLLMLQGFYPSAPLIKYQLAIAYLRKGQTVPAEESLQQAIILEPGYTEATLLLADLQMRRGDPAAAIDQLEALLKREPRNSRARLLLAQAYRQHGDFGKLLDALRTLAIATPRSAANAYLYGMELFQQKRYEDARLQFERSVALEETYWPSWEMLVNLALLEGRAKLAVRGLDDLIHDHPKAADPLLFRARLRAAQGNLDGAVADLRRAIRLNPSLQYAYVELARLYSRMGTGRAALEALAQRADEAPPGTPTVLLAAMIHEQLGEYEAARQAYETVLATNPNFVPALNNLAALYGEKLGQPDKGFDYAQRALALAPDDPAIADTAGWILFEKGDYNGALPLLRRGVGAGSFPEAEYHLGACCYQLGDEDGARRELDSALGLSGGAPFAADARARLAVLNLDLTRAGARALLEDRLRANSNDPVALVRLGALQVEQGDPEAGARSYRAELALVPHSVPTMLALARLYAGPLHQIDRARDLMKTLHETAPNNGQLSWELGRLLFQTHDFAWSLDLLEQAAQTVGENPSLSFDLARGYYYDGRMIDAESSIRDALSSDAAFPERTQAETLSVFIAGANHVDQLPEAEALAPAVLARSPNSVPGLAASAAAHAQAKDYQGARQIYEHILAFDPGFSPAMRELTIIYAEDLGDDVKAEAWGEKARIRFPDDPVLAYELGAISYRKGDFSGAVRLLHDSLRQQESNAEALFYLGMSDYQLKNMSAARDELQRAVGLNLPGQETEEAKQILDNMERGEAGFGT